MRTIFGVLVIMALASAVLFAACGDGDKAAPPPTSQNLGGGISYNCNATDEVLYNKDFVVDQVTIRDHTNFGPVTAYVFLACLKGQEPAKLSTDLESILGKINGQIAHQSFGNSNEFDDWFTSHLKAGVQETNSLIANSLWDNRGYGGYFIILSFDEKKQGPGYQ